MFLFAVVRGARPAVVGNLPVAVAGHADVPVVKQGFAQAPLEMKAVARGSVGVLLPGVDLVTGRVGGCLLYTSFIRHTGMHTNKFALRCLQACEACSSCFTLESLRRPREQALAVEAQALFARAVQR